MADQCRWFAARHKAQQATWALLNLQHQGFVTHWPTFPERIVRRNKVISVRRPIFPGYIFILFSLSDRKYVSINSTAGIVHLLPIRTERPVPLPVGFVEKLRDQQLTAPALTNHIAVFCPGRGRAGAERPVSGQGRARRAVCAKVNEDRARGPGP